MSRNEFDAVIVGAGLSGLSLAAHLATGAWRDRSVLLLDDGGARAAASWATWTDRPGLLDAAVSRSYRAVRVHARGRSVTVPLGGYTYRVVRRDDLHRVVTGLLAGAPGFALRHATVTGVRDGVDAAEVVIGAEQIRASWVFDSRPCPPGQVAGRDRDRGRPDALLAFTGWRVNCANPVFDPLVPTLIDFRVPTVAGACFGYVLPEGDRAAMVELTAFLPRGTAVPQRDAFEEAVEGYLGGVLRAGASDRRLVEAGVLPLCTAAPTRRSGRVVAIGARAGMVRASTGYAYERIQADSAAIAASLARSGEPLAPPRPGRRHRVLDAILLELLAGDPDGLEPIFGQMFERNPVERVLRFLDGNTGPGEEARLILTLTPVPFLRAAARWLTAGRRGTLPVPATTRSGGSGA